MGADQAARTLADLQVRRLQKQGKEIDEEAQKEILDRISAKYTSELDPRYAAARLWVDKILRPHKTREALILALEVASLNPKIPEFKTGVLQV